MTFPSCRPQKAGSQGRFFRHLGVSEPPLKRQRHEDDAFADRTGLVEGRTLQFLINKCIKWLRKLKGNLFSSGYLAAGLVPFLGLGLMHSHGKFIQQE